ncbi:hypothetical protein LINPERPRIM_LOCUS26358 [Linum perenne]
MLFRFCPLLDALCSRALCTFLVNSLSITKPWMLSSLFDMVMNVCESKGCNHVRVPATSILENTSAGKVSTRITRLDGETAYCIVIANNYAQVCEYGKNGTFFCSSLIVAEAIALLETVDLCIPSSMKVFTGSMELQHQGYSILVHLNFD